MLRWKSPWKSTFTCTETEMTVRFPSVRNRRNKSTARRRAVPIWPRGLRQTYPTLLRFWSSHR